MRILVCPVAIINAPTDVVLNLLEVKNWNRWIDGRVVKLSPPGKMIEGQEAIIHAKAFLITWNVKVKVVSINKGSIRYDLFDPLWLKNEENLEYFPKGKDKCEVRYNCNFILPDGIKGFFAKTIIGKRLTQVPEDSIRRLKEEAEKEYQKDQDN